MNRRTTRDVELRQRRSTRAALPALAASCWLLGLATGGCADPLQTRDSNGLVGGRVLVGPGAGLATAHVSIDQVNLYDGKAEIRKHVGDVITDEQGYFAALPTGTVNGLILVDASGGTYRDPINGARVALDTSVHLRALHWLGLLEDRSTDMYVTPVHAFVEARFRYKITTLGDTAQAASDAYLHINRHFGGLDWERIVPADLGVAVPSPTDAVRAAFVLGGLAILADDLRNASHATPQVVNILTLVDAMERDLGDEALDGNDANDATYGSGLQVGDCPPPASCAPSGAGCPLADCRVPCDLYANTYRNVAAESIAKFIGPQMGATSWNQTTLTSSDAVAFTDSITRDTDADLFHGACVEPQHRLPPTIVWDMSPPDGALQGRQLTVHVHAIDGDGNKLPTVKFQGYPDIDGDLTNDFATTTIDTLAATGGIDGPLTVTAVATGIGGNTSMSTRTFQIDNTPPAVTFDSTGLYVDAANVWWTATPGPMLHGTVRDAHPGPVQVMVGGSVVATATVEGTQWSAQLPDKALSTSGNDVSIVATDQAGNVDTRIQTLRLDTTPPSVSVDPSPVFDEINSSFSWVDDATGSFAVHTPGGAPVDLAANGSCPTLHKYAHLLVAPQADGVTHSVVGSAGAINPLLVNAVVADDGVGIQPGSTQYRVLFNDGASLNELLPWTSMPAPTGSQFKIALYRGVVSQLGTTNGEYHIQLRAADRFGRTATQDRCWNHTILASPLRPTSVDADGNSAPAGTLATGFQRALFSTKLNPGQGETGDFAEKLLNQSPNGAAVWASRFKSYVGMDVFVTVQVSTGASAHVFREFKIMNSLVNFRPPAGPLRCGTSHCVSDPPPASTVEYTSDFTTPSVHTGIRLHARLFQMAGSETGTEILPISSDDNAQVYTFRIPGRGSAQAGPIEYVFLTYLRPTLPVGSGLNVTMAPADSSRPDNDTAPYTEFALLGRILTGKLIGSAIGSECVSEDADAGGFFCTQVASRQRYRALTRIKYVLMANDSITTSYSFAASTALPGSAPAVGVWSAPLTWSTDEVALP